MKADDIISLILIMGVIPVTILFIIYFIQKAKFKERMQLLEKGVDITSLKKKDGHFQDVLMWGILSGSVGFGLLVAYILIEIKIAHDDMILGILALLFGGIGIIGYYFISRKKDKK